MKKILLIMTCLLAWGAAFAQKKGNISGKIVTETNEPLPYSLVKLVNIADTTKTMEVSANLDGLYQFVNVSEGQYLLRVKMVGYQPYNGQKFSFSGSDLQLPEIKMQSTSKQLKEVSVVGQKPFVERKADKTVLNVENNATAAGNSVLELLEKAPGVTIDRQTDQIKLNNKAGITVMVDGKTNYLSGADITTVLSNMTSDQVASIELITNPSSKYDAAGNAGIINIKLKRNKNFGTNGSAVLNTGWGGVKDGPNNLYRHSANLNLNHRTEQWNIFGNTTYNTRSGFNETLLTRTANTPSMRTTFDQSFNRKQKSPGYSAKIGADYYASKKTVLGVMVDFFNAKNEVMGLSSADVNEYQGNTHTLSYIKQNNGNNSKMQNVTANFNVKHDLPKEEANITFDVDYANYTMDRNDSFDARYLNTAQQETNSSNLRNIVDAKIDVIAAKTDFSWPFSKTLKFEAGLKSSFVNTNNDFVSEQLSNGSWADILGRSNLFIYKENINAAYSNLSKTWKKWDLQLGLRAEHTHSKGHSITSNKIVDRNYVSLFPSVFLKQELSKNHSFNYSYSRRIDRPSYQQLNPFVQYLDPYTIDSGNPYLNAQFTDNFEFAYNFKEFSLSFNYADVRGMITQVSRQNDATRQIEVQRQNFGHANLYNANLFVPLKITKQWSMQNNFSANYQKYEDGTLVGAQFQKSKVSFNFNTSQSFVFSKTFRAELSFWYDSPRIRGVEETTIAQYALNLGVQKSLMQNRIKLRLSVDDILNTNYWEGRMKYQNVDMYVTNHYVNRRASFSINYSFGNQQVKSARNRKTSLEDIKGRTGG
ncbi:outer membrane beta-barrel family protein [Pedobacter chitinilyticus]|uniref:TonB-dependent receptor n=1 Tax=Pedobacter chitinilyticus TaxID=2233776 RepID=A0A3S3PBA7_9SPHI|nr:outer membrane beta-barrel family protein [Pedobacter chitinilyticus]RWU06410.1 TonB-dependent receptor [Pedobacter chitinilyticus]